VIASPDCADAPESAATWPILIGSAAKAAPHIAVAATIVRTARDQTLFIALSFGDRGLRGSARRQPLFSCGSNNFTGAHPAFQANGTTPQGSASARRLRKATASG
jgi:hypothetical protein